MSEIYRHPDEYDLEHLGERTLGDYRGRPLAAHSPLIVMIGRRAG